MWKNNEFMINKNNFFFFFLENITPNMSVLDKFFFFMTMRFTSYADAIVVLCLNLELFQIDSETVFLFLIEN